ncbi:MAG: DUF418 domain-containing protein [Phocaeicola dorei]|nr:DUF418 domain-containing protein [Phocaeicola dorei]
MNTESLSPVKSSERYIILDVLRGFAILGICVANYPEFSLYTFQPDNMIKSMPTAEIDSMIRYLLYVFVDGKFYTLFSLLFGIGFSIIIANAEKNKKNGFSTFYRRMSVLLLIGFLHLMFIWSGDILMLYALLGMLLPLFRNVSNRGLLAAATIFLLLPIVVDTLTTVIGIHLSAPAMREQWRYCGLYGITEENFGVWLRDAKTYEQVFQFLVQGAWVRMQEFIDGNRYFKVLGLFLLGFYIGRNRLYADLERHAALLKKVTVYGFLIGLPLSLLYAWSGMNGHPLGTVAHTATYTVSVYPLGFAYMSGACLLHLKWKKLVLWKWLAAPGRMALTNYIGQSVIGICLFYGIGLGWGANVGLVHTELIVLVVYAFQVVFSTLWLSAFRFGPLEWGWRMLTYGKWLGIRR